MWACGDMHVKQLNKFWNVEKINFKMLHKKTFFSLKYLEKNFFCFQVEAELFRLLWELNTGQLSFLLRYAVGACVLRILDKCWSGQVSFYWVVMLCKIRKLDNSYCWTLCFVRSKWGSELWGLNNGHPKMYTQSGIGMPIYLCHSVLMTGWQAQLHLLIACTNCFTVLKNWTMGMCLLNNIEYWIIMLIMHKYDYFNTL